MNDSAFSGGKKVNFNTNGTYSSGPKQTTTSNSGGLFASATAQEKQQLKRMSIICLLICVAVALVVCLILFGVKAFTGRGVGSTVIGSTGGTQIEQVEEADNLAEAVANKCLPSVCSVDVYGTSSSSYSSSSSLQQTATGSGVVISKDGYIITNQHVIDGAQAVKVNINGQSYDADIVGQDSSSDIAVVRARGVDGLTPIEFADSDKIKVGEWVMSIGNPFGLEQSVATGIVSATSRSQVVSSSDSSGETKVYPNLIQTDAAINPGNSGGALVDKNGQLIGINALIQSSSGNYSGVGFAIPVNYAVDLARQIIDGKTPSHAFLGITMTNVSSDNAEQYG